MAATEPAPKSLPLILARELAANLATPMYLIDAAGMLVYVNEAAEQLVGKPFSKLGEIPAAQFAEAIAVRDVDGTPVALRDTPAGIAFFQHCPAHRTLVATGYDGVERRVEATAYPLFGTGGEMHGVVSVFWQLDDGNVV